MKNPTNTSGLNSLLNQMAMNRSCVLSFRVYTSFSYLWKTASETCMGWVPLENKAEIFVKAPWKTSGPCRGTSCGSFTGQNLLNRQVLLEDVDLFLTKLITAEVSFEEFLVWALSYEAVETVSLHISHKLLPFCFDITFCLSVKNGRAELKQNVSNLVRFLLNFSFMVMLSTDFSLQLKTS